MQQHQVDTLHFGVNASDDDEWASLVKWYKGMCQTPATEHTQGTVFPLSPEDLRERLMKPH